MASAGCFIAVLIARTHDHMPLCTYTDESYRNSNTVRQQEQLILERMVTPASGPSANGCHYQSFDHRDCIYFAMQDAATDLTIITAVNKLLVRSTGVKELNAIGCSLLDLVFSAFIQEFHPEEILARTVKPFQFIKFESTLQKCITRVLQNGRTSGDIIVGDSLLTNRRGAGNAQYHQLRNEIAGVHDVIRKNYVDLMERGEKLEVMDTYSSQLRHDSSQYYRNTVRMNRMRHYSYHFPDLSRPLRVRFLGGTSEAREWFDELQLRFLLQIPHKCKQTNKKE
eukprot:gene4103-2949_t